MIQAETLGTAVQANYMSAGSPYYFFLCVSAGERGPPGLMVGILLKFLFVVNLASTAFCSN